MGTLKQVSGTMSLTRVGLRLSWRNGLSLKRGDRCIVHIRHCDLATRSFRALIRVTRQQHRDLGVPAVHGCIVGTQPSGRRTITTGWVHAMRIPRPEEKLRVDLTHEICNHACLFSEREDGHVMVCMNSVAFGSRIGNSVKPPFTREDELGSKLVEPPPMTTRRLETRRELLPPLHPAYAAPVQRAEPPPVSLASIALLTRALNHAREQNPGVVFSVNETGRLVTSIDVQTLIGRKP